jgi:hypothetical protein
VSSVEEKYWSALEISFELSKYNIKANTNEIGKLANENDMKNSKYGYVYVCVDDNGEKYEQFLYNKTGRNLLVSMYINARSPKNDVNEITYEKITDFTYISYKEKDNKWLAVIKYQTKCLRWRL